MKIKLLVLLFIVCLGYLGKNLLHNKTDQIIGNWVLVKSKPRSSKYWSLVPRNNKTVFEIKATKKGVTKFIDEPGFLFTWEVLDDEFFVMKSDRYGIENYQILSITAEVVLLYAIKTDEEYIFRKK